MRGRFAGYNSASLLAAQGSGAPNVIPSASTAARRIAVLSCSIELAGVLAVGTWSLADPASFPDATVWSGYGSGYGFVPLVLPVFGLLWLRRWTGRHGNQRTTVTSAEDAGEAAGNGVAHGESGASGQGAEDVVADGST